MQWRLLPSPTRGPGSRSLEVRPPVPNRLRGKMVHCEGLALATIPLQGSSTTAGRMTRSSD